MIILTLHFDFKNCKSFIWFKWENFKYACHCFHLLLQGSRFHSSFYHVKTKIVCLQPLTLSYTGGGGWIPPLLTLVLNSVSGIQAIVLMFGDFS